jgi:type IV pilus assembly protein PilC
MPLIVTPNQLVLKAEVYHQLGEMIRAGLPILKTLETIRKSPPSPHYRRLMGELIAGIESGKSFTQALEDAKESLSSFDLVLLHTGEKSGRLDAAFRLLAGYYQERAQMVKRVMSDLAYPVFVFHFALLLFPINSLVQMVWHGEVTAFMTQKILTLGPVYAAVIALIIACQGQRGEAWRSKIETVLAKIPVLGAARRYLAIARLSSALEALISAGVSIITSWSIAAAASGSPAIQRRVATWKSRFEAGVTPAALVAEAPEFPEMFGHLYGTGEVSGQLDTTLRRLHDNYQAEGTRKLKAFCEWVPRAVYLAVVIGVGIQIVGFYSNYFQGVTNAVP